MIYMYAADCGLYRDVWKQKKAVTEWCNCFCLWANQGLNLGPPDYESVALTNWAISPRKPVCEDFGCKVTQFGANFQIFFEKNDVFLYRWYVFVALWRVSDELFICTRSVFVSVGGVTGCVCGERGLTVSWWCWVWETAYVNIMNHKMSEC